MGFASQELTEVQTRIYKIYTEIKVVGNPD